MPKDRDDEKTGEIVRLHIAPQVAKHGKALWALAAFLISACGALIGFGARLEACSSRYETAARAAEREKVHGEEHKKIDGHLNATDAALQELKAVLGLVRDDVRWQRQRMEREDKRRERR